MVWLAGTVLAGVVALGGFLVWEAVRLSADGRALRSGAWLALAVGAVVLALVPVYGHLLDVLPLARQCIGWGFAGWVGTAGTTAALAYGAIGVAGVIVLGGAVVTALATRRGPLTWAADAWPRALIPLGAALGVGVLLALSPVFGLPAWPLFTGGWPVWVAVAVGVLANAVVVVRSPGELEGAGATARDLAAHRVRVGLASTVGASLVGVGLFGTAIVGELALPGNAVPLGVLAAFHVVGASALASVLSWKASRDLRHGGALVGILAGLALAAVLGSAAVFTAVYDRAASVEVDCSDPGAHGLVHRPLEDIDVWE